MQPGDGGRILQRRRAGSLYDGPGFGRTPGNGAGVALRLTYSSLGPGRRHLEKLSFKLTRSDKAAQLAQRPAPTPRADWALAAGLEPATRADVTEVAPDRQRACAHVLHARKRRGYRAWSGSGYPWQPGSNRRGVHLSKGPTEFLRCQIHFTPLLKRCYAVVTWSFV